MGATERDTGRDRACLAHKDKGFAAAGRRRTVRRLLAVVTG
jgi:hypothetical protein